MNGTDTTQPFIWERSHMTSARFWQILPPLPPVINCQHWATPPDDVSICQTPLPPFQRDICFSKNSLHSTLNVYLIQLKTERFKPKFKYFCWRQQGLDPLPPLSATVSISKPPRLLTSYVNARYTFIYTSHSSLAEEVWHMPIECSHYFIILFRVNQVFTFCHFTILIN